MAVAIGGNDLIGDRDLCALCSTNQGIQILAVIIAQLDGLHGDHLHDQFAIFVCHIAAFHSGGECLRLCLITLGNLNRHACNGVADHILGREFFAQGQEIISGVVGIIQSTKAGIQVYTTLDLENIATQTGMVYILCHSTTGDGATVHIQLAVIDINVAALVAVEGIAGLGIIGPDLAAGNGAAIHIHNRIGGLNNDVAALVGSTAGDRAVIHVELSGIVAAVTNLYHTGIGGIVVIDHDQVATVQVKYGTQGSICITIDHLDHAGCLFGLGSNLTAALAITDVQLASDGKGRFAGGRCQGLAVQTQSQGASLGNGNGLANGNIICQVIVAVSLCTCPGIPSGVGFITNVIAHSYLAAADAMVRMGSGFVSGYADHRHAYYQSKHQQHTNKLFLHGWSS